MYLEAGCSEKIRSAWPVLVSRRPYRNVTGDAMDTGKYVCDAASKVASDDGRRGAPTELDLIAS
jgi:hypothetical protein